MRETLSRPSPVRPVTAQMQRREEVALDRVEANARGGIRDDTLHDPGEPEQPFVEIRALALHPRGGGITIGFMWRRHPPSVRLPLGRCTTQSA